MQLKKRTIDRKSKAGILSSMAKNLGLKSSSTKQQEVSSPNKGEFDDLISALRTGDVFGEDMAKYKRSRKAKMNAPAVPTSGSSPQVLAPVRNSSINGRDDHARERSGSRQ